VVIGVMNLWSCVSRRLSYVVYSTYHGHPQGHGFVVA